MANLAQYDNYSGYLTAVVLEGKPADSAFQREYYRLLAAYYMQNGLYDYIRTELRKARIKDQTVKSLRNPAFRTVEFYASKLWPGNLPEALEIETDNPRIEEPIAQIWEWSNFATRKQRMARWFSIYGDLFLKINVTDTAVYFSMIKPEYVTDMEVDHRGFVTYIRLDVPDGEEMHTELWDKSTQTVTIWRHRQGWDVDLERLPPPTLAMTFQETHGEDFVPIVYQPFRDDGLGRGGGAYSHALDKIDHASRSATRLSQILFRHNRPIWAAMGGQDPSGRPLPPPNLETDSDGDFSMDEDEIISMSGAASLQALVPDLNYSDALAVLQDDMRELKDDLPELAYYDIRDMSEISGRAVRMLLDDAISRLQEARGSAEAALQRADEMALTIGVNAGLLPSVGEFEAGDLRHSFKDRPVLPVDMLERAQSLQAISTVPGIRANAAARTSGYTQEEADELFGNDGESAILNVENEQSPVANT